MRGTYCVSLAFGISMLCAGPFAQASQTCAEEAGVYLQPTRIILDPDNSGLNLLGHLPPMFRNALEQLVFVGNTGQVPPFDWSDTQMILSLSEENLSSDVYSRFGAEGPGGFKIHLLATTGAASNGSLTLIVNADWVDENPGFSVREVLGFEVLHLAFVPTGTTVTADSFFGSETICERRLVSAFETIAI